MQGGKNVLPPYFFVYQIPLSLPVIL